MRKGSTRKKDDGATVGYEAQLWQMADALRGSMDTAEDKHVVLGLIFLSIFWVPPDAMVGIERDNPALKDVLPKDYARPALDRSGSASSST